MSKRIRNARFAATGDPHLDNVFARYRKEPLELSPTTRMIIGMIERYAHSKPRKTKKKTKMIIREELKVYRENAMPDLITAVRFSSRARVNQRRP